MVDCLIAGKEMDNDMPAVTAEWKESCKRAIILKVSPCQSYWQNISGKNLLFNLQSL